MALSDYIPNVFGQAAPSYLGGLLGPEETQNLQNRANVQGLLGAGLALAQGMSRTGPRRSAAENILGALAGGFGAAGGAYEQGVKNYVTQQQIAQTQLAQQDALLKRQQNQARIDQIKAIEKEDPMLARLLILDPAEGAKQLALKQQLSGFNLTGKETPQELEAMANKVYATGVPGLKPYGDSLMQKAQMLAVLPPSAQTANQPVAQTTVQPAQQPKLEPGSLPPVTKEGGATGQFQLKINNIDSQLETLLTKPQTEANVKLQASLRSQREILLKDVDRFAVMEYDFTDLSSLPNKYQPEVNQIKRQAQGGALDSSGLNSRIQQLYTRLQEDEKGKALTGNAAVFAQMKFGVTDRTKLSGPQLAEVLRFEDAPTADQLAKLQQTNRQLQFETGAGVGLPFGKGSFITGGSQVTPQVTTQAQPQVQPQVSPQVTPQPRPQPQVASQVTPQVTPTVTPAPQPRISPVVDQRVSQNPLISQPDSKVPPKKKQELIQAQPGLIAASNYTLKNIVDARNAAQSLLDNPAYIDALSGRTAPLRTQTVGGIVLDQQAYSANEILNNILGRSFISEIQEMRANSPTGGAVGNVAVAEMESLSKIRGAFKVGMDKAELKKQLESYISNANRALKTIPNDYARTYGYNGEFDELLTSEVVKPTATQDKPPKGVTVRRVP
jgi:hypothetical protein